MLKNLLPQILADNKEYGVDEGYLDFLEKTNETTSYYNISIMPFTTFLLPKEFGL